MNSTTVRLITPNQARQPSSPGLFGAPSSITTSRSR